MTSASPGYQTEWEDNQQGRVVHYDGPGLLGAHTLCGYVDLVGVRWADTTKRVNCKACIAVRNHVLGPAKAGAA